MVEQATHLEIYISPHRHETSMHIITACVLHIFEISASL